jgi:nicotinamidase-related amidase
MKIALLVIDLQKAYYNKWNAAFFDKAASYINYLIPSFKKQNYPIIWVQHTEEGVIPGEVGFDYIESLKPQNSDYRITKKYNDSFNKTDLTNILKKENIDTVIISGYCAEYCITASYFGAKNNDINPILLKNGIASDSVDSIKVVENSYDIASVKSILLLNK